MNGLKKAIRKMISTVSPTLCSKLLFYHTFHRNLDLNEPKTLDEKLMWLKLNRYEKDQLVTQCADKYRVRDYVKSCGCERILSVLYGVYDNVSEIPWDSLPEQFVLKCNHGCGYNLICKDRNSLDQAAASSMIRRWMREDYWRVRAELNYKGIKKKIICEEYLVNGNGEALEDYKIYCFHGQPFCIMVCVGREKQEMHYYFFSREWELLPINQDSKTVGESFSMPKPEMLEEMLWCAEKLSAPFPFVRVDLYAIDDRVVFGELTFTPASALDKNRLPETDLLFGSMLDLTEVIG